MADYVRQWAPAVLQGLDGEEHSEKRICLERVAQELDSWGANLAPDTQTRRLGLRTSSKRFKVDDLRLFTCLRLNFLLKGGGSRLMEALQLAVKAIAPPAFVDSFTALLNDHRAPPSAVHLAPAPVSANRVFQEANLLNSCPNRVV